MRLKKCGLCGAEVFHTVAMCPKCGYQFYEQAPKPVRKIRKNNGALIGTFAGVLVFIVVMSFQGWQINIDDKPTKYDAYSKATSYVSRQLKAPSTASFEGDGLLEGIDHLVTQHSVNSFTVRGWVDAHNSFGVPIRTEYSCRLSYLGKDRWRLESLSID